MSDDQKLTVLDVRIAESKMRLWFSAATVVACFIALIPGFPAVSAACIPSAIVGLVDIIRYRRRRGQASERSAHVEVAN